MTFPRQCAELTMGLRALEQLAVLAPVEPLAFARAAGLEPIEAARLFETFEIHGYARRLRGGAQFVLTDLALKIVGSHQRARAGEQSGLVH